MNYMLYFHPEKYYFHMPTVDRTSFGKRLKSGLRKMAAQGLVSDLSSRLKFTLESSISNPSDEPVPCVGRNGVSLAYTLRYSCCRVFPQLACPDSVEWERERTLGYNPTEGSGNLNPHWADQVSS